MATADQVSKAIGCLSTAIPEFIDQEVSRLVDELTATLQTVTDPISAMADLNVGETAGAVAELTNGTVWDNVAAVSTGALALALEDNIQSIYDDFQEPGGRISDKWLNSARRVVDNAYIAATIFTQLPFLAGQKICETIINLVALKQANLACARKHIVQILNAILVIMQRTDYRQETLNDLQTILDLLIQVENDLTVSLPTAADGTAGFDADAFVRARNGMLNVDRFLAPLQDGGTSILAVTEIIAFETAGTLQSKANSKEADLSIPVLLQFLVAESTAYQSQARTINFYIEALQGILSSYGTIATQPSVREVRARLVAEVQKRVANFRETVRTSLIRENIREAQLNMLGWSALSKSIVSTMDQVSLTELQAGSGGENLSFTELSLEYQKLVDSIANINQGDVVAGIEDPTILTTQLQAVVAMVRRVMADISRGVQDQTALASLHGLAAQVVSDQCSRIDASIAAGAELAAACQAFLDIPLDGQTAYTKLIESMAQLGFGRGADMLISGNFQEFFTTELDQLSYQGIAIKCLNDALVGIDNVQQRRQIQGLRDNILTQQTNQQLAAITAKEGFREKTLREVQGEIESLKRNKALVESVVENLKEVGESLGVNAQAAIDASKELKDNIDRLEIASGGRLANSLEEFARNPRSGVPVC